MAVSIEELRTLLAEAGVKPELARSLDPAAPLLRQGVDSVDFPAFCALVEERFQVRLDDEAALALRTLDDFAAYVGQAKG
jgi:acyl carrier protein